MLPFFGKKKSDPASEPETAAQGGGENGAKPVAAGAFEPDPEKAKKWFNHARAAVGQTNYDYALFCYANGLRFHPSHMPAHEEMYEAAIKYFQSGGKPASGSELKKFDGPGPVDKFVFSVYQWSKDLNSLKAVVQALEGAARATQLEFGQWLAPKALNMLRKQQPKKGYWEKSIDLFSAVHAWNEAFSAGERAIELDPTNAELANRLKQLAAQRAIASGGYDRVDANQQGGFRSFIRDADKQKALEEQDSVAGGAEAEERNLDRARRDFEENPMSPEAILKLGQLLRRKGTPEAEEEAHKVYMMGVERLGEYRFRMLAGDIRLAQLRRRVDASKSRLDAQPSDLVLKSEHNDLRNELLKLERDEFRERSAKYPTDLGIKLNLGRIEFELGQFDDAMPSLQAAKQDSRHKVQAAHYLGNCFAAMGWHTEAVGEFREALEAIDSTQRDSELPIKYDLMLSLKQQARAERSAAAAKEAFEICSAILRKDIGYRDIREQRKEIDGLLKEFT